VKQRAAALREAASREAPLTDELKEHMRSVELSLKDVGGEIAKLKAQIEMNVYTSPRVIEEFQQRQKEITERETRFQADSEAVETRKAMISRLHASWLPPLREIVTRISRSFTSLMADIRCTGEVILLEDEHDYSKYAIEIKVSFRSGVELQRLTSSVQSGGEKSVSTMLYITALQDLTVCPFRLVDEINQGMDPKNERMIFTQVVRAAARPGLP
jgi:chromosome segregation ATPase